jgi:hypothetical protein
MKRIRVAAGNLLSPRAVQGTRPGKKRAARARECRRRSHQPCPRRLARPRTSPFHGGNAGSNPAGDAKLKATQSPTCWACLVDTRSSIKDPARSRLPLRRPKRLGVQLVWIRDVWLHSSGQARMARILRLQVGAINSNNSLALRIFVDFQNRKGWRVSPVKWGRSRWPGEPLLGREWKR